MGVDDVDEQADTRAINRRVSNMDRTALALRVEYDEVSMSSIEALEANINALRDSFNEFRKEVRDGFVNVREELKWLRDKTDKNFERLSTKTDATNARIDATNHEVAQLGRSVIRTESKLSALIWAAGVIAGLIPIVVTLGKTFHWF
jgi:predicted  nucleic acid-binding Zn-ribbon protein